jgi:predicted Zn-dependent protease
MMPPLELSDQRHLEAADGWLGLGNWREANEELERITPQMQAHPSVLFVRYNVYAMAKKWEGAADIARTLSELVPDSSFGFVQMAFALHELKRTKEAWNVLLPVVDRFPDDPIIRYNMACYACQLGDLKEAWRWLEKAIDLAGKDDIRKMALDDPDLEPLCDQIGGI